MEKQKKNLLWYNLAMMAFVSVWGFGNIVNNFANQGLTVIVSWILIIGLYFVPYALMVGELGSVFKDSKGGVSSWIRGTFGTTLAYFAGWTYWVVHIPYLAQKPHHDGPAGLFCRVKTGEPVVFRLFAITELAKQL